MALRIDGLTKAELSDALEAVVRINNRAAKNSPNVALTTIYKEIADKYSAAKTQITETK